MDSQKLLPGDEVARVVWIGNVANVRRGRVQHVGRTSRMFWVHYYDGGGQWTSETFHRDTLRPLLSAKKRRHTKGRD